MKNVYMIISEKKLEETVGVDLRTENREQRGNNKKKMDELDEN